MKVVREHRASKLWADGIRTQKVTDCSYSWYYDEINDSSFYDEVTTVNKPTTRYFYDGQMACEEDFAELVPNEDPFFEVTRYGLGARGVDWIEKATVEDTSISFPIYDGHGNVIAQLGRTGSSYSLTQVKRYDVWGGVRSGALGPAGRYCGNLGHVSDDESGLIYMRARYYEPGSGRFVSEDPAFQGRNWYAYCSNEPVLAVDPTGKFSVSDFAEFLVGLASFWILRDAARKSPSAAIMAVAGIGFLAAWFGGEVAFGLGMAEDSRKDTGLLLLLLTGVFGIQANYEYIVKYRGKDPSVFRRMNPWTAIAEAYMGLLGLYFALHGLIEDLR